MVAAHLGSHLSAEGDCTVEVTTIDHELLPMLTRLDLIKLDVEGAECDVIEGPPRP
jgi:FkbM family methyltransferase